MIRYRQIEAFRALMRVGTAIGAARALGVSQPAVSRLIGDLETELGFALFVRMSGRLHATQAGQRFFRAVEENFLGMERLERTAEMIRLNTADEFVLACQPVVATSLLPHILADFAQHGTHVPVRIEAVRTPDALTQLQNRKVLAAICQDFIPVPGVVAEPIMHVPALCAMPDTHRLACREVIHLSDLLCERMIGSQPNEPTPAHHDPIRQARLPTPRYAYLSDTIHTRFALVAAGLGLSIVDPCAAALWRHQGVTVRPFADAFGYNYVLAYLDDERDAPLLAEFRCSTRRVVREQTVAPAGSPHVQAPIAHATAPPPGFDDQSPTSCPQPSSRSTSTSAYPGE